MLISSSFTRRWWDAGISMKWRFACNAPAAWARIRRTWDRKRPASARRMCCVKMIGWSRVTARTADCFGAAFPRKRFSCIGWATSAATRCLVRTSRLRLPFRWEHRCCTLLDSRSPRAIADKTRSLAPSSVTARRAKVTFTRRAISLQTSRSLWFSCARTTSGPSRHHPRSTAPRRHLHSVALPTECRVCKWTAMICSPPCTRPNSRSNTRARTASHTSSRW